MEQRAPLVPFLRDSAVARRWDACGSRVPGPPSAGSAAPHECGSRGSGSPPELEPLLPWCESLSGSMVSFKLLHPVQEPPLRWCESLMGSMVSFKLLHPVLEQLCAVVGVC